MSRDVNGNYTLPAGNPVASGTVITIAWGNATMSDVGSEITNSLDRSGRGGMLAALKGIDGTVAAPAFSFTSEPTSGWYRAAAGTVNLSITNSLRLSITTTGLSITGTTVSSGAISTSANSSVAVSASANYSGGVVGIISQNTSNTASSDARLLVSVAGASAGDPVTLYDIAGIQDWYVGIDNSAGDQFAIGTSTLGTQDKLTISAAGNVTINAPSGGYALTSNGAAQFTSTSNSTALNMLDATNNGTGSGTATSIHIGYNAATFYGYRLTNTNDPTATNAGVFALQRGTGATFTNVISSDNNGSVTVAAPSSGTALQVTAAAANIGARIDVAVNNRAVYLTDGTRAFSVVPTTSTVNLSVETAHSMVLQTSGTDRVTVTSGGNVTVAAPSSGVAVTINGVPGGASNTLTVLNAANSIAASFYDGTSDFQIGMTGSNAVNVGSSTSTALNLKTGNTTRESISSGGNVTINAPSSGVALTVTGAIQDNCGGAAIVNELRTSTATLTNVASLSSIPLPVGTYAICGFLHLDGGAGGISIFLKTNSGTTSGHWSGIGVLNSAASTSTLKFVDVNGITAATVAANDYLWISGKIRVTAAAVIDFQFAQNTSNATTSQISIASYIKFIKVI